MRVTINIARITSPMTSVTKPPINRLRRSLVLMLGMQISPEYDSIAGIITELDALRHKKYDLYPTSYPFHRCVFLDFRYF